jgi:hypothetical protein
MPAGAAEHGCSAGEKKISCTGIQRTIFASRVPVSGGLRSSYTRTWDGCEVCGRGTPAELWSSKTSVLVPVIQALRVQADCVSSKPCDVVPSHQKAHNHMQMVGRNTAGCSCVQYHSSIALPLYLYTVIRMASMISLIRNY